MDEKLTLIDTDILIGILRRERNLYEHARAYLAAHSKFNISSLTWYECLRGYKTIGATKRLQEFQRLMTQTDIHHLNEAIFSQAAEIYALLHRQGKLTGEFDLLIGATALNHGWKLATNNEKHYQALPEDFGLEVENWMLPV